MNRQVKFRGKTIPYKEKGFEYFGEWVFGYFHKNYKGECFIIQFSKTGIMLPGVKVNENSVSQFIEMSDIKKIDVYEGDFLKYKDRKGVVKWNSKNYRYWIEGKNANNVNDWFCLNEKYEIIGNDFDSPELLNQ